MRGTLPLQDFDNRMHLSGKLFYLVSGVWQPFYIHFGNWTGFDQNVS